jgi:hypothetical protein
MSEPMQAIMCSLASLAVANIFYWYRSYQNDRSRREQTLRERVAYMLWITATHVHS